MFFFIEYYLNHRCKGYINIIFKTKTKIVQENRCTLQSMDTLSQKKKKKKTVENMKSPHYSLTVINLFVFFSEKTNLFIYLQYIG